MLTYSSNPVTYTKGTAITANTPSATGGAVASYSVAPALPAGLSLNSSTGSITGTPTAVSPVAVYLVTATNGGGNTTTSLSITVTDVTLGLSGVIAAGYSHTCALVNGGVQCWGDNSLGELGNNSTADSLVPVPVTGLAGDVQAVAAGAGHTCALVNGGVQCWGINGNGQLGNNSTADSHVPVPVTGLVSGVQALTAGTFHTCALVNAGVQCWGANFSGQLGNNSTADSHVPVSVSGWAQ